MAPSIPGFTAYWWNDFNADAGEYPDQGQWEIVERGPNAGNKEVQTFTKDKNVVYLDGEKLIIAPQFWNGKWFSARLLNKNNFHADDGRIMIIQAEIVLGGAPKKNQSGIWPSFWLLGESYRNGGDETWPMCGEIDIFENASGESFAIPAVHYGANFATKRALATETRIRFDRNEYHTWAVRIDRKNSGGNWEDEKIQFLLDGEQYAEVSGRDMGDEERWASVAHQGVFPILQVAVGNNWGAVGSQPDSNTATGPDGGMALKYVAVYFDGSW